MLPSVCLCPHGCCERLHHSVRTSAGDGTAVCIKCSDWTMALERGGGVVRQRSAVMMRASLYVYLLLFSSFSPSSPSPSSSCQTQAQFGLSRMYKTGDIVLGGVFPVHLVAVYPELSFTSKPQYPACTRWVSQLKMQLCFRVLEQLNVIKQTIMTRVIAFLPIFIREIQSLLIIMPCLTTSRLIQSVVGISTKKYLNVHFVC